MLDILEKTKIGTEKGKSIWMKIWKKVKIKESVASEIPSNANES